MLEPTQTEPSVTYQLEIRLRGPATVEGRSGETLAELDVPVFPEIGWLIYQSAVAAATSGGRIVTEQATFPE